MKFQDTKGNEWDVRLTIGSLEEIDNVIPDFSTNIVKDNEKLIPLLLSDPQKVVMMLWVLLEDQAKERSITPQQFGRLFDRDTIDAGVDCLLGAFMSFFQYGTMATKIQKAMPDLLKKFKRQAGALTEQAINEVSLKLDTDSPESLASIRSH